MDRLGPVRRLREILLEAPWSVYDLLSGVIVCGVGLYLLFAPNMFHQVGGVYAPLSTLANERVWGWLFLGMGAVGIGNTLWCVQPSFGTRLLARMGVAFCLLCFAINHLLYSPPPLSTVTYAVLSLWALWGILRTKASGR